MTFFYKIHNNLVTIDKNRYLSEAGGNRSTKSLECKECEKHFHASCSKLGHDELLRIGSGDGAWYCSNCKADCGLCTCTVLNGHKAVQCDRCDMWIHNECSFIAETQDETVKNKNCSRICPNVNSSTFLIPSLVNRWTWKLKIGLFL